MEILFLKESENDTGNLSVYLWTKGKVHQLSVKGKTENFTRSELLSLASEHSMPVKWAEGVIDEIVKIFSSFPKRGEIMGIDKEKVERIAKSHRLHL